MSNIDTTTGAIAQNGNPVLRMDAKEVPRKAFGTKELTDVLIAMAKALGGEPDGVAIAAPQIGVSMRMFLVSPKAYEIIDEKKKKGKKEPKQAPSASEIAKPLVFINPELIKLSRKKVNVPEGCLSVRWLYGNTMRHEKAMIRAQDAQGNFFTYGGSGLIAQIFQHETDHLKGILFVDHATDIEELSKEEVAKIQADSKK